MVGRSIFGSSVSMNNEFNFKGKKTEIKSPGKACTPVKMGDRGNILWILRHLCH